MINMGFFKKVGEYPNGDLYEVTDKRGNKSKKFCKKGEVPQEPKERKGNSRKHDKANRKQKDWASGNVKGWNSY